MSSTLISTWSPGITISTPSGRVDFTGHVEGTDVELGTIVVVERSVTTTFLFLEDVDRSFELAVGFHYARVADNHTAFDIFLVDTTEKETNVVTSFAFVKKFAEHFDTGNGRFEVSAKTHDLNFVANFDNTLLRYGR